MIALAMDCRTLGRCHSRATGVPVYQQVAVCSAVTAAPQACSMSHVFEIFDTCSQRFDAPPWRPRRNAASPLRRRALAWSLSASIALTAAGCGSTQLSRAQLVKKADAICNQVHTKMKAAGTAHGPKQIASLARKLASFEQQELEQMRKLNPPAALASDWKKILEGAQEVSVNIGTFSTDAQTKRNKQAGEALKRLSEDQQRVAVIVKRDGLTSCVQLD